MDHESEDTLPEGEERANQCRHFDNEAGIAIVGKIVEGAISWKGLCGTSCYDVAAVI